MWSIFYTILGNNEAGIAECRQVKNIMLRLKNKYKALGRNTTLEQLCGNRFYRNEMTVTKYLSGMLIKNQLELFKKNKNQNDEKTQKLEVNKTKQTHERWPRNVFHHVGLALTRKAKLIEEAAEMCRSHAGGKCGECSVCQPKNRRISVLENAI